MNPANEVKPKSASGVVNRGAERNLKSQTSPNRRRSFVWLTLVGLSFLSCQSQPLRSTKPPLTAEQVAILSPFLISAGPFDVKACTELLTLQWPKADRLNEIGDVLHRFFCVEKTELPRPLFSQGELSSPFLPTYLKWAERPVLASSSLLDDAEMWSAKAKGADSLVEKKSSLKKLWDVLPLLASAGETTANLESYRQQVLAELVWLNPTLSDSMNNALLLRRERKFTESDGMLLRLADAAPDLTARMKTLAEWRQNIKIQGDRDQHLVRAKKVSALAWQEHRKLKTAESKAEWVKAALTQARALWTEEKALPARKILFGILQFAPELGQDAHFVLGRMAEEGGLYDESEKQYLKSLSLKPDRELKAKLFWQMAWIKYRKADWPAAQKLFLDQAEVVQAPLEKMRARFWSTLAIHHATEQPEEAWRVFFHEDPFGFYGQMSLMMAGQPLPGIPLPEKPSGDSSISNDTDMTVKTLQQLAQIQPSQKERSAQHFGQDLFKNYLPNVKSLSVREKIQMYLDLKLYKEGILLWTTLPVPERNEILAARPADFFPQPYQDSVLSAYEKTLTPTPVIYSIMRQESLYDPEARSPVDAFGLMQVLPEHAAVSITHHEDLFEPSLNILSGAKLLQSLHQRYGSWIMTFCAYNGSEKATDRWRDRYKILSPLEFIESIPYEETRTYAKTVLRNWLIYSRLGLKGTFEVPKDIMLSL